VDWEAVGGRFCRVAPSEFERESAPMGLAHTRERARLSNPQPYQTRSESARSRGKVGGRPKALTAKEVQMLRNMASDRSLTVSDICKTLGIGRTTFYRYVNAEQRP
jgi:DNA invertase Pin-like site-specific DNA recombinase